MLLTLCYVPCVPRNEKERKHGSHGQGSLTLQTLLGLVKRVELTRWGGRKEKRATYNNHNHMHHNVLGDVGMCYSHPVMFHVFPVMKRRENMAAMSKVHWHCKHCWGIWKEWDVLLTICYVPCVPRNEKERKHDSHEQGSLTLQTLLEHVKTVGLT